MDIAEMRELREYMIDEGCPPYLAYFNSARVFVIYNTRLHYAVDYVFEKYSKPVMGMQKSELRKCAVKAGAELIASYPVLIGSVAAIMAQIMPEGYMKAVPFATAVGGVWLNWKSESEIIAIRAKLAELGMSTEQLFEK
jgi:hypothetical protein